MTRDERDIVLLKAGVAVAVLSAFGLVALQLATVHGFTFGFKCEVTQVPKAHGMP